MRLQGTDLLPAPVDVVWKAITAPETLRRCTPGLKALQETGPDTYEATLEVGIAAVKGIYFGTLSIGEKQPPRHCTVTITGRGGAGFLKGEGRVDMEGSANGEGTVVKWAGDIQVGGLIAGVGQRMLGGVAKLLIGQFFKRFHAQLNGEEEGQPLTSGTR